MGRRANTRNSCQRLRTAVYAMPRTTREAMLRGIDENTIIVGAYVDSTKGGICPMLAAHRNGGRTDLASFARSWDRYTDARRPRLATRREVLTLRSILESSLIAEDAPVESVAVLAGRIRAERDRELVRATAELPAARPAAAPVGPPESPGMRIRIRKLIRRAKQPVAAD